MVFSFVAGIRPVRLVVAVVAPGLCALEPEQAVADGHELAAAQ
jgi:hypothetical protein